MKRNELLYRARVPCPTKPSAVPCDAATRLRRGARAFGAPRLVAREKFWRPVDAHSRWTARSECSVCAPPLQLLTSHPPQSLPPRPLCLRSKLWSTAGFDSVFCVSSVDRNNAGDSR